ncbi:hypothetical protein [Clostridium rectalis]|uniref:hypothetical protein n=1 Tax=Clostridium rectalis TaxID=2040295 RepID=UPI000F642ED3|nr:hypothetical protein [Clostridium rectalis]
MKGICEYKNKVIQNVKYKSENRWFICERNGERTSINGREIYPQGTLKEAKEIVDRLDNKNHE